MKLIDKNDLVREIDRQKIGYNVDSKHSVEYDTTRKILNIINSLEVKEVELDKPFKGISVKTSFDGDDNLDTITITTKYYKKKGG